MCAQYRTAAGTPTHTPLQVRWYADSEQAARGLLATCLAPHPHYLGAAPYLPVVDALCRVANVQFLSELPDHEERFRVALLSSMVAVDRTYEETLVETMRVLRFLKHVGGDVTGFLAACRESERARMTLALVMRGDPCRTQYLLGELGIDERTLPTGGAAAVAVRLGLNSVADTVWGTDALRESVRRMLRDHPPEAFYALQFYSDVVCQAFLGCSHCGCGGAAVHDAGHDVLCVSLKEGWP